MNRRSLFRALGAALAAPAVAAVAKAAPPAPAPLLRPVPTSQHGPWVASPTHNYYGHHSQMDPSHAHGVKWDIWLAPR